MAISEKDKMLAGEWYNTRDPELMDMYHLARDLLQTYNSYSSRDVERHGHTALRSLLGELGEGVWIEAPFHCDYGSFISIGDNTFLNGNCFLLDDNHIRIGKNCLLGPYVQIYTSTHPLRASDRVVLEDQRKAGSPAYRTRSEEVRIGDNVWIGGNAVILPGVHIGDNTTIGAGSVVTTNVPSDVLAAGNPCKILRQLQ